MSVKAEDLPIEARASLMELTRLIREVQDALRQVTPEAVPAFRFLSSLVYKSFVENAALKDRLDRVEQELSEVVEAVRGLTHS